MHIPKLSEYPSILTRYHPEKTMALWPTNNCQKLTKFAHLQCQTISPQYQYTYKVWWKSTDFCSSGNDKTVIRTDWHMTDRRRCPTWNHNTPPLSCGKTQKSNQCQTCLYIHLHILYGVFLWAEVLWPSQPIKVMSVNLLTLYPGQAKSSKQLPSTCAHTLISNWQMPFLIEPVGEWPQISSHVHSLWKSCGQTTVRTRNLWICSRTHHRMHYGIRPIWRNNSGLTINWDLHVHVYHTSVVDSLVIEPIFFHDPLS